MLKVDDVELNPYPNVLVESNSSVIGIKPYPYAYTPEVLKDIKIVNFSDSNNAVPFGSYIYRVQKYPGDIDLIEEFRGNGNIDDVVKKFGIKLVQMVKKIVSLKSHYMVEFKMGIDDNYDIYIGDLDKDVYYPNILGYYVEEDGHHKHIPGFIKSIDNLHKRGLLDDDEINKIKFTLGNGINLNHSHYDIISNVLRERRVLRWSDVDILKGYKIKSDGKKITIDQALRHKTHVKIDMISIIEGRFVEVTNFVFLVTTIIKNGKEQEYILNFGKDYTREFFLKRSEVDIPTDIEKLFYSDRLYNPFKGAKRLWALARHYKDFEMLYKIKDLISGNISLLYMLKSEIGTILRVLEKLLKNKLNIPTESINYNLELIKERIGFILNLNKDTYFNFVNLLNVAIQTTDMNKKFNLLENIEDNMKEVINIFSVSYLRNHGLASIPFPYLPYNLSYITNLGQQIK